MKQTNPGTRSHPAWRLDRLEWLLFGLFLICSGYFNGGSQWNQNARFDAIRAFVEPGYPEYRTFSIDRFVTDPRAGINTGDWSYFRGHFYANKAPGTILLGTLVYLPVFHLERALGADPEDPVLEIFNVYLINLLVSGLAVAVALVFFKRLVERLGLSSGYAAGLAAILGFGTMLYPYSVQFWGHVTAASWVCGGLFFLTSPRPRSEIRAGFCLGMAAYCEYLCAVTVVSAGILLLTTDRKRVAGFIAGGIPALLGFMLYHWVCFGSPFVLATHYVNPIFVTEGRLFGFFDAANLGKLLFSRYRGLLVHMPILLCAPIGWVCWARRRPRDPMLWLTLGTATAYLLINASFNGWHGGWTVGARYQIAVLPLWVLAFKEMIVPAWSRRWSRLALAAALLVSVFNMTAVAAVSPTSPYQPGKAGDKALNPIYLGTYDAFFQGRLSPLKHSVTRKGPVRLRACNAGELLGLKGLWSLLPLGVIMIGGGILLGRWASSASPSGEEPTRDTTIP